MSEEYRQEDMRGQIIDIKGISRLLRDHGEGVGKAIPASRQRGDRPVQGARRKCLAMVPPPARG